MLRLRRFWPALACTIPVLALGALHTVFSVSMYLPLMAYRPLPIYTPSSAYLPCLTLAYLCRGSFCCGIWSSLLPANDNMKVWLLRRSLSILPLHSSDIVIAPCDMTIQDDCCVIDVVSWHHNQLLLLALHAFTIVDVVDPHWSKRLVVAGTILLACCDQPPLLFPMILLHGMESQHN